MRILAVNILALIFLGGGVLYVDQLQNTLIQTRTDELIKDAVALNNPSSKEQYIGKLEVQVEMT